MKRSRRWNFVAATLVVLGTLVVSFQAKAAVQCHGDLINHIARVCHGVTIGSDTMTTYDVTWVLPDYPTSPLPIFDGADAPANALAVAGDINTALNDAGFTNIEYATGASTTDTTPVCSEVTLNNTPCYYVPYRIDATDVSTHENRFVTGSWSFKVTQYYPFAEQNTRPVAVFTPALKHSIAPILQLLLAD